MAFSSMNRIWRHLSSVMAIALLSSSVPIGAAVAADMSVKIRGGDHAGYTRLVFEGKETPRYTVEQNDTHIILKFPDNVSFEAQGMSPDQLSRVESYKVLENHSVEIDIPKGITVRHFIIDKRVIVDLKGEAPVKKDSNKKSPVKLTEKIEETRFHPESKDAKENIEQKIVKNSSLEKHVIVDDMQKEEKTEKAASPTALKPHAINIAGTTVFAMAAFEKGNNIWIVIDKPDVVVPPQFEGSEQNKLGEFQRFITKDVTVFRAKRPERYKLSGNGGGLVWKIDMTETDQGKFKAKPVSRKESQGEGGVDVPSLVWEAPALHRIAQIEDPDSGEKIWVGLVNSASDFTGEAQYFSEIELLPSIIGAAALGKVDDLSVSKSEDGAIFSRPGGLTLSSKKDMIPYLNNTDHPEKEDATSSPKESTKIFAFRDWKGADSPSMLSDNQRLILSGLLDQTDQKKTEGLVYLGRMMLSSGFAPEASGYFDLAQHYTSDLSKNPEFKALQGVSEVLSGNFKEAFVTFSNSALDDVDEIKIWKSYALSGLDDWQQASKTLPSDMDLLKDYPPEIMFPVGLRIAEVTLREGNKTKAAKILDMLDKTKSPRTPIAYSSGLMYLKGELARQKGDVAAAKSLWSVLETGKDDLYRAKSRLAMATLRYGEKEITIDKAIDALEGLRYAWRGDDLETSINYNLGKLYLEKGEPIKALGLMRLAAGLIPNSEQGKMISTVMHATFQDLYMTDKIQSLSPFEALTLYNEFSDLVPAGAEGDRLARQLAERLVDDEMLPRAINLLKQQVDTRLSGLEGATVAIRLASLQVLNNKPKDALASLEKASGFLTSIPSEESDPKRRQIALLKAKALSLQSKPEESLASLSLLTQDEDVLRLRADIAWKAKRWQEAADALEQLVAKQDISLTRPLDDVQAKLIMDWSVALYLADNRYVLANLRERYSDPMSQTSKAREFEVVTRPRQNILLADRDTINGIIGETDMFKDFLDSLQEDLTGPVKDNVTSAARSNETSSPSGKPKKSEANIPESLKNEPQIKADEVLAD